MENGKRRRKWKIKAPSIARQGTRIREIVPTDTEASLSFTQRIVTRVKNQQTGGRDKKYWTDVPVVQDGEVMDEGDFSASTIRKHAVPRDDTACRMFGVGEKKDDEGRLLIRKQEAK